jgi:hypothetical protein
MSDILTKLSYIDGYFIWKETINNRAIKGTIAGTTKKNGYCEIQYLKKRYYVHRLVWEWFHGEIPQGMIIDHIDRNPSRNVISNLRCVPQSVNLHNTSPRTTNKSGYKGISWDKKVGKWVAAISYKGKRVWRKWYDNILDANHDLVLERNHVTDQPEIGSEVSDQ